MPGKTDWESAETWQRVVASIIATGVKVSLCSSSLLSRSAECFLVAYRTNRSQLDLKAMATIYGCTYDTLENRFRKIKKLAVTLKEEANSGERDEIVPEARTKSAPSTPRKPKTPKKDPLSCGFPVYWASNFR